MATTTNLDTLKINYLTQAQYDTALANNQINSNQLYFTPSSGDVVEQNATSSSDNGDFRVLLSGTASDNNLTETVRKTSQITYNPSTFSFKHYAGSTQAAGSYIESNGEKLIFITPSSDSAELSYSGLKLNNSKLISTDIDKLHHFANPYKVSATGPSVSLNNTNFNVMQSFTITEAGTYLVSVIGMFPSLASSALKIVRLTSNTSTDALTAACEATLPSTVAGNLNKVCFTVILDLDATTYRIQMKTASATNASGYSAYSYVRLS